MASECVFELRRRLVQSKMYGLINLAIEEAILERYGQKFWNYIKQSCRETTGDTDGAFISRLFYDDEVTYRLIDAAERILRSEKYGHVSQLFGEKFYELVQDSGYEGILQLLGGTLQDFLNNLDSFHSHLATTYGRMKPPSFRCSHCFDENNNSNTKSVERLILHYYSERIGLEGIVMGMVKAAARELHGLKVDISIHQLKLVDQGIDHTEFMIKVVGRYDKPHSSLPIKSNSENQMLLYDDDDSFTYKNVPQLANAAHTNKVSPSVFAQALPFHLIFNRDLVIKQAGTSILRIIPALNEKKNQIKLTDVMKIIEPKCLGGRLTFDNMLKYINSVYVFRPDERQVISGGHRHLHGDYLKSLKVVGQNRTDVQTMSVSTGDGRIVLEPVSALDQKSALGKDSQTRNAKSDRTVEKHDVNEKVNSGKQLVDCALPEEDIDKYIVKLRGQMIYMKDKDLILFVCSPSVANLDDLNNTGLFLSDIPLHDATRDLVLLSEQFEAEYKVQKKLTMLTEQLNVMKNELEEEKKKTDRLLYSVLPPTVANELRNNRPVPAKRFQPVTILFSGIVGFSDFCAKNSDSSGAIRIVNLLNKIYTTFDVLTEPKRNPYVYKVETVGDKYMAVSGLPEACDSHARHINRLALDIFDLAKTIKLEEYTGVKPVHEERKDHSDRQAAALGQVALAPEAPALMDQCEHLRVTVGIHCGEVVTGVIGKRTPRYCLFGNTVNLTSRCETTGKKGFINVSQDVYNLCTKDPNNFDPEFDFQYRGQINMKGKSEPMRMWFLSRRPYQV